MPSFPLSNNTWPTAPQCALCAPLPHFFHDSAFHGLGFRSRECGLLFFHTYSKRVDSLQLSLLLFDAMLELFCQGSLTSKILLLLSQQGTVLRDHLLPLNIRLHGHLSLKHILCSYWIEGWILRLSLLGEWSLLLEVAFPFLQAFEATLVIQHNCLKW